MGRKHIPQRTCVACREVKDKRELVRVVRTIERGVEVDETGKKSGRGAYLCRSARCWQRALETNALSRALKVSVSVEQQDGLRTFMKSLPQESAMGEPESATSGR